MQQLKSGGVDWREDGVARPQRRRQARQQRSQRQRQRSLVPRHWP